MVAHPRVAEADCIPTGMGMFPTPTAVRSTRHASSNCATTGLVRFDSMFFRCHISVNAVLIETREALIAATVAHATFSPSWVRMSRVGAWPWATDDSNGDSCCSPATIVAVRLAGRQRLIVPS